MERREKYLDLLGIFSFIVFTVCTFSSMYLYPTPYSPLYDWLSNLGNYHLNPVGYIIFNMGCFFTSIILIPFFINLRKFKPPLKYQKTLVYLVIILGVVASLSLMGVGLFPETHIKLHTIAASGVFGTMFLIIIFLMVALFKQQEFKPILIYWGLLAVLTDLIFVVVLRLPQFHGALSDFNPQIPIPGLEWASVYTSLIWVALLSYILYQKDH
jgi:hypothetical protein